MIFGANLEPKIGVASIADLRFRISDLKSFLRGEDGVAVGR
jgi:hypothetical protein